MSLSISLFSPKTSSSASGCILCHVGTSRSLSCSSVLLHSGACELFCLIPCLTFLASGPVYPPLLWNFAFLTSSVPCLVYKLSGLLLCSTACREYVLSGWIPCVASVVSGPDNPKQHWCFCSFGRPLSCQILYHDSVSMIISRFTSFTKEFVIWCHQVTKLFLLEVLDYQWAFCKEPLQFWSSCTRRNLGLSGSERKYCACHIPLLWKVPDEAVHERCLPLLHMRQKLLSPLNW